MEVTMRRPIVVVCAGFVILIGPIVTKRICAQYVTAPAGTLSQGEGAHGSNQANLRSRVAKLRAEVELLRLEHDAEVAALKPALAQLSSLEPAGSTGEGQSHPVLDRRRRAFLRQATAWNDKSLELEEAEALYRKSLPSDAPVPANESASNARDDRVQTSVRRMEDPLLEPVAEPPASIEIPVLGPILGESGVNCCTEPPSEQEIWEKVPPLKSGMLPFFEAQRTNVHILTERIGQKIDVCKYDQVKGFCQLVHCHYKCTVYFDETVSGDLPAPFKEVEHHVEVLYIDKDYFRRCESKHENQAAEPHWAENPPAVPGSLPISPRERSANLQERLDRLEVKFAILLKVLELEAQRLARLTVAVHYFRPCESSRAIACIPPRTDDLWSVRVLP